MTFNVSLIGAGPSAFYLAGRLLKKVASIKIWMYDREATPFGLLRYGVAPDNLALKVYFYS